MNTSAKNATVNSNTSRYQRGIQSQNAPHAAQITLKNWFPQVLSVRRESPPDRAVLRHQNAPLAVAAERFDHSPLG
jgi:hypothetical protein